MILAIRTDKPESEVYIVDGAGSVVDGHLWEADRKLSAELLPAIEQLLRENKKSKSDITGVIVWEGPGSFTGLRIGISVANALAYALGIPVVGTTDDGWIERGTTALQGKSGFDQPVVPEYGAEPNTTKPRK